MDLKLRTKREKNILNLQKVKNREYCLLYYRHQDILVKYESQPLVEILLSEKHMTGSILICMRSLAD